MTVTVRDALFCVYPLEGINMYCIAEDGIDTVFYFI